jgi:hypothetical protein
MTPIPESLLESSVENLNLDDLLGVMSPVIADQSHENEGDQSPSSILSDLIL